MIASHLHVLCSKITCRAGGDHFACWGVLHHPSSWSPAFTETTSAHPKAETVILQPSDVGPPVWFASKMRTIANHRARYLPGVPTQRFALERFFCTNKVDTGRAYRAFWGNLCGRPPLPVAVAGYNRLWNSPGAGKHPELVSRGFERSE
jgi:hypothetical protein